MHLETKIHEGVSTNMMPDISRMSYGMSYKNLKPTLMDFYGVGATQLDDGESVPYSVYCTKSFFLKNGEWTDTDPVKMGKSSSVANRVRTYGQDGADVKVLWSIDCVNANFATKLERDVHKQALPHSIKPTHAREIFLLDVPQAYNFLNELEEVLDLKNNSKVLRINRFTSKEMHVYEANNQWTGKIFTSRRLPLDSNKFNELFDF